MGGAYLCAAGHDGLPREQLREDAAGGPQVDCCAVCGGPQQQLGGAVPEGDHAAGEGDRRVGAVEGGQPEVSDFEDAVVVQQQVAALDVAVQHAPAVAVLQPAQQLGKGEIGPRNKTLFRLRELKQSPLCNCRQIHPHTQHQFT